MKVAKEINDVRNFLHTNKQNNKIAFVPTMGNLHEGHLALIRKAKELANCVVVSIFVNPLQFSPNEDFSVYPRTLESDIEKLKSLSIQLLFTPNTEIMYPNLENQTRVSVPNISDIFCGSFRPQFFYGVTTVVAKLFNIVQPDFAVFGEKDFQQLHIIKKMVYDLAFPVEIISVATEREKNGLAMSSRNQYLSGDEKILATEIYNTLCTMKTDLQKGNKNFEQIVHSAISHLEKFNFKIDYISICNQNTLALAAPSDKNLVILIAAWLNTTRLIDNLIISLQ